MQWLRTSRLLRIVLIVMGVVVYLMMEEMIPLFWPYREHPSDLPPTLVADSPGTCRDSSRERPLLSSWTAPRISGRMGIDL